MSEIRDKIKEFSDDFLLEQFYLKKNDYTEEALAFMKEEISLRNLEDNIYEKTEDEDTEEIVDMDDELAPLDSKFNRTDLVLAQSILTEEKIPFFVSSSTHSSAIPRPRWR